MRSHLFLIALVGVGFSGNLYSESDSVSQLKKQSAKSVSDFSGSGLDLVAIDILQGKFKIPSGGQPTLFPSPYPFAYSNVLPRFDVRQVLAGSTTVMAPQRATHFRRSASNLSESKETCKVPLSPPALFPAFTNFPSENAALDCVGNDYRKLFQVDKSGMLSSQSNTLSNQEQEAYLSVPDMSLMSEAERNAIFSNPNSTMPASLSKLKPVRVVFKEFVYHDENDPSHLIQALKGIKVQVGNTLAMIPLNTADTLPPPPSCELVLKTTGTIREGNQITLGLRTNSVTRTALFSAPDLAGGEDLIFADQDLAASTVGPMKEILEFTVTVPDVTLFQVSTSNPNQVLWQTEASVKGVDSSLASKNCELNIPVEKVLPPVCSLDTAINPPPLNQPIQITLNCGLANSGPVNTATINGTPVSLVNKMATISYTKTAMPEINLSARAVGPGGESNPKLNLLQNPGCPHNDPNYFTYVTQLTYLYRFRRAMDDQPLDKTHEIGLITMGAQHYNSRGQRKFGNQAFDVYPANSFTMEYYTKNVNRPRHSALQVGPKTDPNCKIERSFLRDQGCFEKNTNIAMADGSQRKISNIMEGDYVFNPHYQTGVRVRKVVKGPEKKSLYEVQIGKNKVEVTEDHPFLTQRGWVQAMHLKAGDKLFGEGQGKVVAQSRKLPYKGPEDVWNFELDTEDPLARVVVANGVPTGELSTQLELKKSKKSLP